MIGRMQPPAHSPLDLQALTAGLSGALGHDVESRLQARMRTIWGARDVVLTNSGTAALTLALLGAIRIRNALVALPGYGCYDLATAAIGARARVVLYDLDPETLSPDFSSLRRAVAAGASVIVVVHQYGIPVPMEPVLALAAQHDALVIEDAAQAIGARLDTMPAGAAGHLAVMSFGRGKGLTGGNGGALLSNHSSADSVVRYARQLVRGYRAGWRDLGQAAAQWLLARPSLYSLPSALPFLELGRTVFHEPSDPGPLSRVAAQLILRGWNSAHAAAARRRATANRLLRTATRSSLCRTIRTDPALTPGYLRLPLLATDGTAAMLDHDARTLGIVAGYPIPLRRLPPLIQYTTHIDASLPGADTLAAQLFTVPTHTLLTAQDIERLEQWLLRGSTREKEVRIRHVQGTHAIA